MDLSESMKIFLRVSPNKEMNHKMKGKNLLPRREPNPRPPDLIFRCSFRLSFETRREKVVSVIAAGVNVRIFSTVVYFSRVKFAGVKTSLIRENIFFPQNSTKSELKRKERAQAIP